MKNSIKFSTIFFITIVLHISFISSNVSAEENFCRDQENDTQKARAQLVAGFNGNLYDKCMAEAERKYQQCINSGRPYADCNRDFFDDREACRRMADG